MIYKKGDKVIPIQEEDGNEEIIGKVEIIIEVTDEIAKVEFDEDIDGWGNGNRFWNINIKNLRLNDYSWEDFKKCSIGTKVYFENGEILVKCDNNNFSNEDRSRDYDDLEDFKDTYEVIGKIVRVEEPVKYNTYFTKYKTEPKEMTLAEISKALGYNVKIIKEEVK